VLLVAGAIPGERVEVTVERVQKHTVWARVSRVIEASPDRLGNADPTPCGGHVLAHVAPARQHSLKAEIVADAFARIGRLPLAAPVPVVGAEPRGYRMRARLQVAHGAVGFFREGSHAICDAVATGQLGEGAAALVAVLAEAVRGPAGDGVRAIDLSETVAGDARAVHVEGAAAPPIALADALHVAGVRGVSWAAEEHLRSKTLWGEPWVEDTLAIRGAAVRLRRHARSFFQGHRYLLVPLVDHVLDAVAPGPLVDLYAGVGLFAVSAAAAGIGPVLAVEGDRSSAGDLRDNAQAFPDTLAVLHAPVERALAGGLRRPETVVLDPPRTGATPEALRGIIALAPARVVYVSCDVATLARDARGLVAAGYALAGLRAFDLFPQTAHVECVAVFAKA
jgi:23S rRNA (uracil1939-C5)-methyltransferase